MDTLHQLAASLEAGRPRRITGDQARAEVTDRLHALVEQLAEAEGISAHEARVRFTRRLTDDGAAAAMDYIRSVLDR
jgi:hypothetical protein